MFQALLSGPSSVTAGALRRRVLQLAAGLLGAAALALPPVVSAQALPDFTELVERVGPSVVNIRTMERGRANAPGAGEVDPGMEEFFRRFGIPIPGRPGPRSGPRGDDEPQQRGVGSGFILSADGFIMTNAHVVDGADEVLVTLTDKREFKAKIIGADKRTDVAVVKIDAAGLPFVKIGDVNRLKVGEWVMAIGSPFGLENSVTAGIVSAKQRDTGDYLPFIQTDVAINPGNSGGPADKAGVEAGDIITRVEGKVVEKSGDLPRLIGSMRPGSKATLQVFRRGASREVSVTVGEFEADRPTRRAQAEPGAPAAKNALGITASDLTDAQKRELKVKGGVRVDAVEGAAARAGLREGDVILSIDNTEITDTRQFAAVAAKVEKARAVSVLVRRGEWVNYLVIRPSR